MTTTTVKTIDNDAEFIKQIKANKFVLAIFMEEDTELEVLVYRNVLRGNLQKKEVYSKTLSRQVGGWSRPFQKILNELIFDIRWGQIPFIYNRFYLL